MEGFVEIREAIEIVKISKELAQLLEEEEIICPTCLEERPGKYLTREALDELRVAKVLMEEMGVNLEGVDIILRLRRQIMDMQAQFQKVLSDVRLLMKSLDR